MLQRACPSGASEQASAVSLAAARPSSLEGLYREASDPVLRTHLLMVWPTSLSDSLGEVARMVGYLEKWTREIAKRYGSEGVEGLGDLRHGTTRVLRIGRR